MKNTTIFKKILFFGLLLGVCFKGSAQQKINWISIEEAFEKTKLAPKKIIIDVYTDWCGWCKVMDRKTFTHPEVIKYVNQNYYAVKLDAESKSDFKIGSQIYKFDPASKSNQIAIALLKGKMSYPSIVYLDEKFAMIQPIPGYMEAKAFHEVITFIGGNYHKKEDFEKYKSGTYKTKFKNLTL